MLPSHSLKTRESVSCQKIQNQTPVAAIVHNLIKIPNRNATKLSYLSDLTARRSSQNIKTHFNHTISEIQQQKIFSP